MSLYIGRMLNKQIKPEESFAYDSILKALSQIIQLVIPGLKGKYPPSSIATAPNDVSLIRSEKFFSDLKDVTDLLSSITDDSALDKLRVSIEDIDSMRLAEEIAMEDDVYTDDEIGNSLSRREPRNLTRKQQQDTEDDDTIICRLHYIKSDMFIDYCSATP